MRCPGTPEPYSHNANTKEYPRRTLVISSENYWSDPDCSALAYAPETTSTEVRIDLPSPAKLGGSGCYLHDPESSPTTLALNPTIKLRNNKNFSGSGRTDPCIRVSSKRHDCRSLEPRFEKINAAARLLSMSLLVILSYLDPSGRRDPRTLLAFLPPPTLRFPAALCPRPP